MAGEYGDGLVFAIPPRGVPPAEALARAGAGAARRQRPLGDDFHLCALTNIVLLDPGEPVHSERVIRTVGPNVMASVYYFYDAVQKRGIEPPPFLRRIWKRYCALVAETSPEHRHFRTHEGDYTYIHASEAALIDAELIRDTCLVGTAEELIERIRELERGGLRGADVGHGGGREVALRPGVRRAGDGPLLECLDTGGCWHSRHPAVAGSYRAAVAAPGGFDRAPARRVT